MMQRREQTGFTLIELMVTIAVAAVLVALAVPSFRDLLDKSRLRGATDDIVNLLNTARSSAVKLGRDVNVSINASKWCAGAVSASDPATIGDPATSATACDCTASAVTCKVAGQDMVVSSTNYASGFSVAGIANVDSKIDYGGGSGGITFNSKFGALDLGNLPGSTLLTVTSPTGRYGTRISISPLGQTYVCVNTGNFVSGYPSC